MLRSRKAFVCGCAVLALAWGAGADAPAPGRQETPAAERRDKSLLLESRAAARRAMRYLAEAQQEDGSWRTDPAITALVVTAMLGTGQEEFGVRSDTVKHALQYIRSFARPDGGIFDKFYPNYTTSICAMALVEAGLAEDEELLHGARQFLLGLQADEGEGIAGDNPDHGGWGYEKGDDKQEGHRPDLSNTQMALEAVRALEEAAEEDRPEADEDKERTRTELAYGMAIQYLMRCQNDDGGFIYRPDESKAGERPDGGLRSYGSMTYAGLKSMVHARLKPGDPRVRAAFEWARAHWSVTENPGLGQQGLYYYYQTMAKALRVYGQDVVVDARGNRHDWRVELVGQLLKVQHADGSWVNENGRWMERIPELVTAYSLLAIGHATQEWQSGSMTNEEIRMTNE